MILGWILCGENAIKDIISKIMMKFENELWIRQKYCVKAKFPGFDNCRILSLFLGNTH